MSHSHDGRASSGLAVRTWRTPHDHEAGMEYREGTSDWNTISACLRNPLDPTTGDEYHLPEGLTGWALDVGAHIGSVTIGLLLDNPGLRVVAIEAVPDNAELIRRNLAANSVADRCVLLEAAAWKGTGTIDIEYGYTGSEVGETHAYIGSVTPWMANPGGSKTATVPVVTLKDALVYTEGAGFVWVKTDCEGCEHPFFRGGGMKKVGIIEGEWHQRDGTPEAFAVQLSATHDVTWSQGIGGGPFKAVPR